MTQETEYSRETPEEELNRKKTNFFSELGLRMRRAVAMHQEYGLLEKKAGLREWGNVSEHCLVEAARAEVFAGLLGLTEKVKQDLVAAAAVHDFHKKHEIERLQQSGSSWQHMEETGREATVALAAAGWDQPTIRLVNAVGLSSLKETRRILRQTEYSEEDIAFLVAHYIDVYTINAEWVRPATTEAGQIRNDIDRRVDKDEANPKYQRLNEEGRQLFEGQTAYAVHREVGYEVEKVLTNRIVQKTGRHIEPKKLPEIVDQDIRSAIERLN